jgi:hypothetical protein
MRRWLYGLLIVVLFLGLAAPVWADDGQGQVVYPGSNIVVKPGEEIKNDVAVLGGSLDLREGGRISGNVTVIGGNATVDGHVSGDFVIIGGNVELRSHAVIDGDLVTFGANATRAEGAVVHGQKIEGFQGRIPAIRIWPFVPGAESPFRWGWRTDGVSNWLGGLVNTILNALAMMTLGALLVFFLPKPTARVGETVVQAPLATLGVGLLTLLALPVLLLILIVICVGIPVAILLVLLAIAAGIFGWIAIGAVVGQRFLAALKAQPVPLLEVIIGVGLLALLASVPCLGWLLWLLVVMAGMGAVVLTRFGTLPYAAQRAVTGTSLPQTPAQPPVGEPPTPIEPAAPTKPESPVAPTETAPPEGSSEDQEAPSAGPDASDTAEEKPQG